MRDLKAALAFIPPPHTTRRAGSWGVAILHQRLKSYNCCRLPDEPVTGSLLGVLWQSAAGHKLDERVRVGQKWFIYFA